MIGDDLDMNLPAETERGHLHAGAGVPDVRDGAPRRRRPDARGAPRRTSARCGPTSATSRPATSTRGSATPSRPRRSPRSPPTNRMIGLPYPKYMNSNNDVDMGAAIIMCSVEAARRLGRRRGSLGVPALGHRLPRAHVRVPPRHVRPHAGDRARRPARPRARRRRHRRHRRSSTCTRASPPRCSSARRRSASTSTASGRAPAACRSPAARGTTT